MQQHYSPLDKISRSNISELGFVWEYDARNPIGRVPKGLDATPLLSTESCLPPAPGDLSMPWTPKRAKNAGRTIRKSLRPGYAALDAMPVTAVWRFGWATSTEVPWMVTLSVLTRRTMISRH